MRSSRKEGEQARGPFPPPGFFLDDPENGKESGRLGEDASSARSGEAAPSVRDGGAGVDKEGNGGGGTRPTLRNMGTSGRTAGGRAAPTGRSVQATGPAVPDGGRIVPREA